MPIVRFATSLLLVGALTAGWPGTGAADDPVERAGPRDPVVEIVRPLTGVSVRGSIPYGAIRVHAYDRDAGTTNGAGIRRVRVTVRDAETGRIVRRKTERWRPYDFGFVLGKGRYTITARAVSTAAAGGTWSQTKIRIRVDPSGRSLPKPQQIVRRERAEAASLAALNELRATVGAAPVALDPQLSDFAYYWSQVMSGSGFRHSKGAYAENIAWYSDGGLPAYRAAGVFNSMWRDSSGHYRTMTERSHRRIGIGLSAHGNGWWGTHVFD